MDLKRELKRKPGCLSMAFFAICAAGMTCLVASVTFVLLCIIFGG